LGEDGKPVPVRTVGYTTATQEPNAVIHIITSHNRPELEIELNEAWVLSRETVVAPAVVKLQTGSVKKYRENYPDGKPRVTWSAGAGEDGRCLLEGLQVFYYAGGRKQWETTFATGRRVGVETYWRPPAPRPGETSPPRWNVDLESVERTGTPGGGFGVARSQSREVWA